MITVLGHKRYGREKSEQCVLKVCARGHKPSKEWRVVRARKWIQRG